MNQNTMSYDDLLLKLMETECTLEEYKEENKILKTKLFNLEKKGFLNEVSLVNSRDLECELDQLKEDNAKMRFKNERLESKMFELRRECSELKKCVDNQFLGSKRRSDAVQEENELLKKKLASSLTSNSNLKKEHKEHIDDLGWGIDDLKDQVNDLRGKLKENEDENDGNCAICFTRKANILYEDCSHLAICAVCNADGSKHGKINSCCPNCRGESRRRRVFLN